jgi:hypothetical protein
MAGVRSPLRRLSSGNNTWLEPSGFSVCINLQTKIHMVQYNCTDILQMKPISVSWQKIYTLSCLGNASINSFKLQKHYYVVSFILLKHDVWRYMTVIHSC